MSFVAALLSASLSFAYYYPVYVPIKLQLNLSPLLLGKINYFGDFTIMRDGWKSTDTKEITYEFYLDRNTSKTILEKQLSERFMGSITPIQLDTGHGIQSTKIIQNDLQDNIKKYFKPLLGKKSIDITSVKGDFNHSKTIKIVFKNLRTPKGFVTRSTNYLRFVFNYGTYDVYYRHSNDPHEIRIQNIDVKIKVSTLLSSVFSIEMNNGALELIKSD